MSRSINGLVGKTVIFGEVGLSGEVRAVSMASQRVAEAKKLGFDTCILPLSNYEGLLQEEKTGMRFYPVSNVSDAVETLIK